MKKELTDLGLITVSARIKFLKQLGLLIDRPKSSRSNSQNNGESLELSRNTERKSSYPCTTKTPKYRKKQSSSETVLKKNGLDLGSFLSDIEKKRSVSENDKANEILKYSSDIRASNQSFSPNRKEKLNSYISSDEGDTLDDFLSCKILSTPQIFRKSLSEIYSNKSNIIEGIPIFLYDFLNFLTFNAINVAGLFRISGDSDEIIELKRKVDFLEPYYLSKVSVHTIACVVKTFFGDLPEPIIPLDYYSQIIIANEDKVAL